MQEVTLIPDFGRIRIGNPINTKWNPEPTRFVNNDVDFVEKTRELLPIFNKNMSHITKHLTPLGRVIQTLTLAQSVN
jgi:hypothetical protein